MVPPWIEDEFPPSEEYLSAVDATTLPDPVASLADEYDRTVGERDRFLWRWIHALLPAFTLSCVPDEHFETARTRKTILTMFTTLLDDLAENHRDRETFEEARLIPFRPDAVNYGRAGVDADYLELVRRVWSAFDSGIADAPNHGAFVELLECDLRQTINAIDYCRVVNEHVELANMTGIEHYGPHNMIMFPYADVDLMYSPAFDARDLAPLRETVWELQKMARIGNWITTWQRELREGDYASGPIITALREGIVSVEELDPDDLEAVARVTARLREREVERRFMTDWYHRYERMRETAPEAESVDIPALVEGMETVLAYQLAARGYK